MNVIKPLDPHVVNILSVYAMADRMDKFKGMTAYRDYHRIMHGISIQYKVELQKVCAVFAALSPNATYESNLSSTRALIEAYVQGGGLRSFKVSTYDLNKCKAWLIMHTPWATHDPGAWITAKKTSAFYKNIFHPTGELTKPLSMPVVVDGHMYSVWMLEQFGMQDAQVGNGVQYDQIEADIRTAAKVVSIGASQMQAVCWFTWKRVNRISYDVRELQHRLWIED